MLLLATEVWGSHGGIQRYMRMISRILANRGEQFAILTLLDSENLQPLNPAGFSLTACNGSKLRFCLEALRLSRNGTARATVVGHVALLPLAWALQHMRLIRRYAIVLHGIEAWQRLPWVSRVAARDAFVVVATTRYTITEFCFHNRLDGGNCMVIPLASTLDVVGSRHATLPPRLQILTISRLSSSDVYKGIETILRALQRGKAAGLNWTLELVGEGDDRPRLEDLSKRLGVDDAVCFRGASTDEEVEQLFAESHVFVLPSKNEGFGIVFLEAMAAGLPCIGANHGGTPEIIEHGESGFLIEYGDADQLVFYLRVLTESPALYKRMSRAARLRATATFSFPVMAASWGRLLDHLNGSVCLEAAPGRQTSPKVVAH